ncbi:conserved hypothetical protein [Shewanella sediminis HAW-EB3]|uniref:HTH araC/xylS-type domain-containing protein n=1 Tax=Shewanella sediminis (strain HAW-EB3) TaxID=425104 RepID=A8FV33_SHESH|nr:helix-turn-helix domain-containing protein [Shewanella sediminis]ABV36706.1 conserved hypothetical protein [Shewanella sediminis HAW-EB3]
MKGEIVNVDFVNSFSHGEFVVTTISDFFENESLYNVQPYIPHRLTFFAIVFFTGGKGSHSIDFTDFKYEGASLFFICKGQLHAFEKNEAAQGYVVYFTEEFINKNIKGLSDKLYYKMFNYALNSPQLPISELDNARKDATSLFDIMYHEYSRPDDICQEEIIRGLLGVLLSFVERIQTKNNMFLTDHQGHALFLKLQKMIDEKLFESRTSHFYCENLNVSYRKLNAVCKEFTDMTVRQFIDERLVLEIKRYLAHCDFSIKEICYKTGFDEPTNMTKFFKCHTGMSPKEFRLTVSHKHS